MNGISYKPLWILLLIAPFVVIQVTAKVCCMTLSLEDLSEECGTKNIFQWQNITRNLIKSCTKLLFLPKNYTLTQNINITTVNNFVLNGSGATFYCNSSSLIIGDSTEVQILNIKFINCGHTVNNFVKPNNLFPLFTKAAIILHNSSSVTIRNTVFKNSYGYAVIGVNVEGESFFENITVTCVTHLNVLHSKQQSLMGGILLIYTNTTYMDKNNTKLKLFIKQCNISNIINAGKIEEKIENNIFSLDHLSLAVGFIFYQQPFHTEIQIYKLMVTNTTSLNGPHFLVSTHSIKMRTLNLTLNSSIFSYNKNKLYPIISCLLNSTYPTNIQQVFILSNSEICNNNATHIFKFDNTANESANLVLEDINQISNNTVTESLFSVSGVIPVLRNQTVLANNTADIIFSFSKYIRLDEQATVKVCSNKYNPAQKSFNRFIFEKTNETSKECPFQLNQAAVTLCKNVGYYRELYGNYLEYNCSWTDSLQQDESPEWIYRRTFFNCDKVVGYFK